jgi:hypothetical protein
MTSIMGGFESMVEDSLLALLEPKLQYAVTIVPNLLNVWQEGE